MGERVADDLRLLVDLLGHEVAVVALFGQQSARGAVDRLAFDDAGRRSRGTSAPGAGDDNPVALLEIGDAVGERGERQRVGAEKHLAVAVADRERRALARADQQVVLAVEQIDEREGAAHPLQRRGDRLGRLLALRQFVLDQERRRLPNRSRWRSDGPWRSAPRAAP